MSKPGSIESLRELPGGWDGFNSPPISAATITAAEKFATDHQGQVWWFAPMSNGNVMACRGENEIEIEAKPVADDICGKAVPLSTRRFTAKVKRGEPTFCGKVDDE